MHWALQNLKPPWTQAPAADLRRHAASALQELPVHLRPPALQRYAQSQSSNNAERDLLRLLRKLEMSLPLNVDHFRHGLDTIYYIKLTSWFKYLMSVQGGGPLIGGFLRDEHYAGVCLKAFWEGWRHGRESHAVYALHNDRLQYVIPYALHLDEGRGLRKSAVLVVHLQTIFGDETRQRFESQDTMLRAQFHNGKGTTLRTRFLITCLPKAAYTKQKSGNFTKLFEQVAEEATELLESGIKVGRTNYFFALVAVKGDAPALAKAGNFTRNFQRLGNPICWECLAGDPRYPFEDCRPRPSYEASIHTIRPWQTPPPLSYIPGCPEAPERLFQRDPFHVYKQSIGGSYVASCIVLLSELGYYDVPGQNGFEQLMDRILFVFKSVYETLTFAVLKIFNLNFI